MSQPPVNPEQPPYGGQPPTPPGQYPPPPGQYPPPPAYPPAAPVPPPAPWQSPSDPAPTMPMPPVPPAPPVSSAPPYGGPPYSGGPAYPPPYTGQAPQPGQGYPPGAAPAPTSSNRTLIIVLAVVGVLIMLCCLGGVGFWAIGRAASNAAQDVPTIDVPAFNPPTAPSTRGTGSTTGTGANSNLAMGKTASFTDSDGTWTVTVNSRTWRDTNCDTNSIFPEPDGKLLVVDITFEVKSGTASINPLYFDYVDSAGKTATWSLFTGCDEPDLGADNDLPAGTKRTGRIAFDVEGGQTGQLTYDPIFSSTTASWAITA